MERAPVNLRNLERIQEGGTSAKTRAWTIGLAVLGSAAVASATMAMSGPSTPAAPAKSDEALALLVKTAKSGAPPAAPEVTVKDLSYPKLLSDAPRTTTALVAVKDERGELIPLEPSPVADAPPPPPALDRLPVVPLPTGTLLNQTTVTTEPKDELLAIAVRQAEVPEGEVAPMGSETEKGFALQLASFKNQDDADKLVGELRKRGHTAYRQAANVPDRGLWHRVRVGPFKSKYAAELYKTKLNDKERISALLIDPEKAERAERVRTERLAERIRKFGTE